MNSLKEEFEKRLANKTDKELREAKELLESYILIAEKFNVSTINAIVDAMTAVEQVLEPFNLPSLKAGLDSAEADLAKLISSSNGNDSKKTGILFGKAMAFWQGISEFLRQELPTILRSRLMAQAKKSPQDPVGPRFVPMFSQALAINKPGGFIRRFFTSSNIPYIDNNQFAQELSMLSFEDLTKLSNSGKVPTAISNQNVDQIAASAVGSASTAETPEAGNFENELDQLIKQYPLLEPAIKNMGGAPKISKVLRKTKMNTLDFANFLKILNALNSL